MTAKVSIGTHRADVLSWYAAAAGAPGVPVDRGGDDEDEHGGLPQATIHSGHFMVSCVHEDLDDPTVQEEEDAEANDVDEERRRGDGDLGYNFENASRIPSDSYQFGVRSTNQLSIDASLTGLFNHMTLAYSGKITSPKWKNFKGIKVKLKDKIRLNNLIWREWHMQYIKRQEPIVCQFEAPISDRTHSKPEAVVLEGKYWKRRLQCLTTEYKKWRLFYKHRNSRAQKELRLAEEGDFLSSLGNYERLGAQFPPMKLFDEQTAIDDDYWSTFANDTLFPSLNPPFPFPDPREISRYGFGDIIQPNLIQLQPSFDDPMDTLAPLPGLNEYREFIRGPNERSHTRKTSDEELLAFLIDEPFPNETSQQVPSDASLDLQSAATPKEDSFISQLQQQLAGTSSLSPECCLNLFMTDSGKPLPVTAESGIVMTGQGDPFFSAGLCNEPLGIPKAPSRRTSDQPLRQNFDASALDAGHSGVTNNRQMASPCKKGADAGELLPFPGRLDPAVFLPVPGGNVLQTITIVQDCTPSHGGTVLSLVPQAQWSPAPSQSPAPSCASKNSSGSRASRHSLTGPVAWQPCLRNDANYDACRRHSSGSPKSAKAKKRVSFLSPQPPADPSSSAPKQRHLAPALAPTSESRDSGAVVVPSGLINRPKGKTSYCPDQKLQSSTILAKLLTQGRTAHVPTSFASSSVAAGGNWNESASIPRVACQEIRPAMNLPSSSCLPVTAVCLTASSEELGVSMSQSQPSSSSFSNFHKSLLSAAVSQALGVETRDSREVTASLFDNILSRVTNSMPSSPALPAAAAATAATANPSMLRAHLQNESTESANDEEMQLPDGPRDNRRCHHLSAEQRRRSSIQNGFEVLNQLVSELSVMAPARINKAAILLKAAECCRRLKSERQTKIDEVKTLRCQIDELQAEISSCQAQLPATGVPVVRPQTNLSRVLFQDYVRTRILSNWKFWIFSFLIRPLFDTFDENVVTTSSETFCQSVLTWLKQHCSLPALRPAALNALRELSTTTSILVNPSNMPHEATESVQRNSSSPGGPSYFKR